MSMFGRRGDPARDRNEEQWAAYSRDRALRRHQPPAAKRAKANPPVALSSWLQSLLHPSGSASQGRRKKIPKTLKRSLRNRKRT